MVTEYDEKQGMVKTCWSEARKKVVKVEPKFAAIVDSLSPDKSFPLYLAYYPYGDLDGDTQSTFFPDSKGSYYRVTDDNAPKDVVKHLGYSAHNTPGKMFPLTRILRTSNNRIYSPNGVLESVAGSRSAFMLPNIGCATNHSNLQREFNVRKQPPKSLYEHWGIFKEILNCPAVASDWRCCVMYFSEKWLNHIMNDCAWANLNKYLYETAWQQFIYEVNRDTYDMIFSIIQQDRNLKPNPYLTDTAKHLFSTAIGSAPGYAPATNDDSLPISLLQKAYTEIYGLKKYIPSIMQPVYFNYEVNKYPVYYSLQNPATHVFSPKSRETSSTLFEMRELEYVVKIFAEELSKKDSMCSDTIMGSAAREVQFNYFHNKTDRHQIIKLSTEIGKADKRFLFSTSKSNTATFASDSTFLRGCISIKSRIRP